MNKSGITMVRSIMLSGRWLTIPLLQKKLQEKYGRYFMETTISARIRNLRLSRYGGYDVQKERLPDSKLFRYRLVH